MTEGVVGARLVAQPAHGDLALKIKRPSPSVQKRPKPTVSAKRPTPKPSVPRRRPAQPMTTAEVRQRAGYGIY